MRSVAPITKIVPLFLWSAKMPKIYAKCKKFIQKLWNFIFCHLYIVRAVFMLSFKLLVRSVAQITKIVPPFLWFQWRGTNLTPGGVYVTNIEGFAIVGGSSIFGVVLIEHNLSSFLWSRSFGILFLVISTLMVSIIGLLALSILPRVDVSTISTYFLSLFYNIRTSSTSQAIASFQ